MLPRALGRQARSSGGELKSAEPAAERKTAAFGGSQGIPDGAQGAGRARGARRRGAAERHDAAGRHLGGRRLRECLRAAVLRRVRAQPAARLPDAHRDPAAAAGPAGGGAAGRQHRAAGAAAGLCGGAQGLAHRRQHRRRERAALRGAGALLRGRAGQVLQVLLRALPLRRHAARAGGGAAGRGGGPHAAALRRAGAARQARGQLPAAGHGLRLGLRRAVVRGALPPGDRARHLQLQFAARVDHGAREGAWGEPCPRLLGNAACCWSDPPRARSLPTSRSSPATSSRGSRRRARPPSTE